MQAEGIGHLKISKDPTGNRTRNLLCYGVVHQSTAPPLAPSTKLAIDIALFKMCWSLTVLPRETS